MKTHIPLDLDEFQQGDAPTPAPEVAAPVIDITEVESSTITRIGYDAQNLILFVKFAGGGWYAYEDVPADKHKEFLESKSKGKHFHSAIRPKHLFARVVADENDTPQAPKIEQ